MIISNTIGITLLLVLAIAVWTKQNRRLPDTYLLLFILFSALYLLSDIWVNYSLNKWSFAFQNITSYLSFIPFFFYAMLLISKDHQVKKSWWGFAAFHIAFILFVLFDVFVFKNYTQTDLAELFHDPPWVYHFFYKGLQAYIIAIMIWFIIRLKRYQHEIEDYYSNVEEIRLDWLKYFSWIYVTIYSASLVSFLLYNVDVISDIKIPYLVISGLTALSLFWLIYKGMRQYKLANLAESIKEKEPRKKYMTSSLSNDVANDLYELIQELFEEDKIYHNPNLKVQHIAEKLGVTNHNISQVLSQKAGKSFFEFVNDYRLHYFMELLADPDKKRFTILALGMESGFNSKASLNRIFKQQIGKTPREFQQQMLAS